MKKITDFLPLFTAWAIQPVSPNLTSENHIEIFTGDSIPLLINRTGIIVYFTENSY